MITGRTLTTNSFITTLLVAVFLTISANFVTMMTDQLANTQFNPVSHACAAQGGGC